MSAAPRRASSPLPVTPALCLALAGLAPSLACETYVPPPSVAATNLAAGGLLDPGAGALRLELSEPIDPATFTLSMRNDVRGLEGELCTADAGGALPEGCARVAEPVIAPCALDPTTAERADDGLRYVCTGGAVRVDAARRVIHVEPTQRYAPYGRYVVSIAAALAGDSGRRTGVPLEVVFQVAGDLPRAPTTFTSGQFFAVIDIFEPIPAQFQFFFFVAVRPETGELRFFAADADPNDASIDPKTNRDPKLWKVDVADTTGATLRADGQVADTANGQLLRIYPFTLLVKTPPVEGLGTEVTARVERGTIAGAPAGDRDLITGTMSSPSVALGLDAERSDLGPGRGAIQLFRLAADEERPLESLLPVGADPAIIRAPFGD
jgi:hypothetical protein